MILTRCSVADGGNRFFLLSPTAAGSPGAPTPGLGLRCITPFNQIHAMKFACAVFGHRPEMIIDNRFDANRTCVGSIVTVECGRCGEPVLGGICTRSSTVSTVSTETAVEGGTLADLGPYYVNPADVQYVEPWPGTDPPASSIFIRNQEKPLNVPLAAATVARVLNRQT